MLAEWRPEPVVVLLTSPTRVGTIATGSTISPKSSSKPDIIEGKVSINDNKQCWSRKSISAGRRWRSWEKSSFSADYRSKQTTQLFPMAFRPPREDDQLWKLTWNSSPLQLTVQRDFDKTYSEFARSYSGKRNLIIFFDYVFSLESLGVFQPLVRNMRHW